MVEKHPAVMEPAMLCSAFVVVMEMYGFSFVGVPFFERLSNN